MNKLERFIQSLESSGYIVPKDAKFYEYKERIGLKVGEYHHQCPQEYSDIYVLLVQRKKRPGFKVIEAWDTGFSLQRL